MSVIRRYRSVLLGVAAFASVAACLAAALAGSVAAAVPAVVPAILVLAALRGERPDDSAGREAILLKMAEQAEAGRKTAIYDRDTGLLIHWYMILRGEEECRRAGRYGRPLALMVVEPDPGSDAYTVYGAIALWLRQGVRAVDVVGCFGKARFAVIMPETDIDAAENAAARLRNDLSEVRTGVSAFPDDGTTFEEMYAVAADRLNESVDVAV